MSLFALYKNARHHTREDVDDALSGNLCRCTGYRPILAAAERMVELEPAQGWRGPGVAADGSRQVSIDEERLAAQLETIADAGGLEYRAEGQTWFAPRTLDELATLCAARPAARIVAGTTDIGLWITKQHRDLGDLIYVGDCADLRAIHDTGATFEIGAGASLADAFAALDAEWPELREAWIRFASVPIRNSGTLGGNIANGSPIGDAMPVLMALSATLILRHGQSTRELALEDFYLAYQKTALMDGELVVSIRVPRRPEGMLLRAYKISKRFDQDISAVFACFALTLREGCIVAARIGCGGVAPIPTYATTTEALLVGRIWDDATAALASAALAHEFTPLSDMRASDDYRRRVLGNLMQRFRLETRAETSASSPVTRIHDPRLTTRILNQ